MCPFCPVYKIKATVAQLVEHLTRNEDVSGSIPDSGSNNIYISYLLNLIYPLLNKAMRDSNG